MKDNVNCYLFVFNGYSDWEPALISYALTTFTDVKVIPFSIDGKPITSGGGIRIEPQLALADVHPNAADLLLLPGGVPMESGAQLKEILPLVTAHIKAHKPLAAICGATVFLAEHGFLDHIKHTSNDLWLLKMHLPDYKGAPNYIAAPSVTDQHIITAPGTAMVAFTQAILEELDLLKNEKLSFWFQFFKQQDAPQIQTVPPMHFFSRSFQTDLAGLFPLIRTVAKDIFREAIANDLEIAGPIHWHYYNFDGQPNSIFTLEIGVPITTVKSVPVPYDCKTLPAFSCVSQQLLGSWEKMAPKYHEIISGILPAGLKMSGNNREQYIHCDFDNPEANVTNIQVGILQ
jgi:putative intracellular protease/amidase/effector-binding domain-containing protein